MQHDNGSKIYIGQSNVKNVCCSTNKQETILDFVINVARNYTLNAIQIHYTALHLAGNAVICIFLSVRLFVSSLNTSHS